MTTTVLHNQGLLDIAIQHHGSAQAAFTLGLANNISLTDALTTTSQLQIVPSDTQHTDIANFYSNKHITPATAAPLLPPEGVSFWAIEHNFTVQ